MIARRRFLKTAGIAVGATLALSPRLALAKGARRLAARKTTTATDAVATQVGNASETRAPELFDDLRVDGFTVVKVELLMGAVPVLLEGANGRFQVDVLRKGGAIDGVAQTRSLSLFLLNKGDGSARSNEEQAQAAQSLARVLEARESAGMPIPALLTFDERRAQHPDGAYNIDFVRHDPVRC